MQAGRAKAEDGSFILPQTLIQAPPPPLLFYRTKISENPEEQEVAMDISSSQGRGRGWNSTPGKRKAWRRMGESREEEGSPHSESTSQRGRPPKLLLLPTAQSRSGLKPSRFQKRGREACTCRHWGGWRGGESPNRALPPPNAALFDEGLGSFRQAHQQPHLGKSWQGVRGPSAVGRLPRLLCQN